MNTKEGKNMNKIFKNINDAYKGNILKKNKVCERELDTNVSTSNTAITLIALIITIIILLILAAVTLNMIIGENGIINKANIAKEKSNSADEEERVKLSVLASRNKNGEFDREIFLKELEANNLTGSYDTSKQYTVINTSKKKYMVDNNGNILEEDIDKQEKNLGLLGIIDEINETGYTEKTINNEKYNLHSIVIKENVTLDGNTNIEGATLNNKIYEFGDKQTDVATGTTNENMAQNTVVLKIEGDLTINSGVTLTTTKSDNGYGGPKGLIIYCTGKLINNGTISMTARGAFAEGQDIYLWKNNDGTYEIVPKYGAEGAPGVNVNSNIIIKPKNATGRQTGGGAGGSSFYSTAVGGNGARGTSYSGGSGGRRCWK